MDLAHVKAEGPEESNVSTCRKTFCKMDLEPLPSLLFRHLEACAGRVKQMQKSLRLRSNDSWESHSGYHHSFFVLSYATRMKVQGHSKKEFLQSKQIVQMRSRHTSCKKTSLSVPANFKWPARSFLATLGGAAQFGLGARQRRPRARTRFFCFFVRYFCALFVLLPRKI